MFATLLIRKSALRDQNSAYNFFFLNKIIIRRVRAKNINNNRENNNCNDNSNCLNKIILAIAILSFYKIRYPQLRQL